jgi:hypothetical protein
MEEDNLVEPIIEYDEENRVINIRTRTAEDKPLRDRIKGTGT